MHFCGVVFLIECGIIFPLHFRSMIWSRQESHMDINDLKRFACAAGLGISPAPRLERFSIGTLCCLPDGLIVVLHVIAFRNQSLDLKKRVRQAAPDAFIIVYDANEVLGKASAPISPAVYNNQQKGELSHGAAENQGDPAGGDGGWTQPDPPRHSGHIYSPVGYGAEGRAGALPVPAGRLRV